MSVTKLIAEQTKLFTDLDKRFAEKVTKKNYESRIKAVTETQEKRIEERIASLEKQKSVVIVRYDVAIKAEKEALKGIAAHRLNLDRQQEGKGQKGKTPGDPTKPSDARPSKTPRTAVNPTAAKAKGGPVRKK